MPDKDDELVLVHPWECEFPDVGLSPLPGRMIVWQMQESERNGILLPISGRCKSDVGFLAHDYGDLPKGTPVACRPYRGATFEHESGLMFKIYGVAEPVEFALMMAYLDGWVPVGPWSLVEMESIAHEFLILNEVRDDVGRIVKTNEDGYSEGMNVVCEISDGLKVPYLGKRHILTRELYAPLG